MNKLLSFTLLALFLSSGAFAEQTLTLIKPDAVAHKQAGEVISIYENSELEIIGLKMIHLSKERAEKFYAVHKERPFYKGLVQFMSSGPIIAIVLEGDDAVAKNRALIGATNPEEAKTGTLRKKFGSSVQKNAVHGSDSKENAQEEILFFFQPDEL